MIAIGLLEIMRKGRRVPECIRLIGNINARTALSKPYRIAPLPITLPPAIPRAIRVACYRRYHTATIRPSPPSDDPPIQAAGHHIGYWKCSASGASRHPQMLWNLLPAFFLIFWKYPRISLSLEYPGTNSFPSQTRHHMATQISRPIFGAGPHKIIRQVSILGHAHVEGLELESETSPAGLVLATWPIAGVWVRGVANRAGRDLLWHPQDIARALPSSLRPAVPNTNGWAQCTASAISTSQYPKNLGGKLIESKSSWQMHFLGGLLVSIRNIGCHKKRGKSQDRFDCLPCYHLWLQPQLAEYMRFKI